MELRARRAGQPLKREMDEKAWDHASLETRLRSYPGAPPGADALSVGYVGRLMEEAAEAIAMIPLTVTASHAALIREHTELQQKYSDLTGRYEALVRDCHPEYSGSRPLQVHGKEPEPLRHIVIECVRVPRSGDMADVVAAQVRQPED
jgi:hypothetical protein